MERNKWVERLVWLIFVFLIGHIVFDSLTAKALLDPNKLCHSTSEDSAPYDCDYDGDTNSWTRR
jgi:hypothetical protein